MSVYTSKFQLFRSHIYLHNSRKTQHAVQKLRPKSLDEDECDEQKSVGQDIA